MAPERFAYGVPESRLCFVWAGLAVFDCENGAGYVFEGADHDRRGFKVSLNQAGWRMHMQISVTNFLNCKF